jgi:hypothetical protein
MESMKKRIAIAFSTLAVLGALAPAAFADPAFGPGNGGGGQGNSGPQDGKCHPPGQTTDTPGCK